MAVKPTATEIRERLEGYDIDTSIVSDTWINNDLNEVVIPLIEDKTGMSFNSEESKREIYSGNGSNKLILDRRDVKEVTKIEYVDAIDTTFLPAPSSVEVQREKGILISKGYRENMSSYTFPKGDSNIAITYKVGYVSTNIPDRISSAMKNMSCANVLKLIAGRTGGGNQGTQAHSPNHGDKGRFSNEIKRFRKTANSLLQKYMSSVVGS
jgi:hypothetical protein